MVQFEAISARNQQGIATTANSRKRLAEVVPGAFIAGIGPEQGGKHLPRLRTPVFYGQESQQGLCLLARNIQRLTIGPASLERAKYFEFERSGHGSGL
jgi:hypothetical protein